MPLHSAWISRIESILESLRAIDSPWLDRRAMENLFRVKPRRAQQIMRELATVELIGKNTVVRREELIGRLEGLARGEQVVAWRRQRQRAADEIVQAQAEAATRQMPVPEAPGRLRRRVDALPATVHLSPGRLEVRFANIPDLWRQLGELAGAAAADPDTFLEAVTAKHD